jgi:hypothetical protein
MNDNADIIFDPRKITEYLLVWKPQNDKSGFLIKLGYSIDHWEDLRDDILQIIASGIPVYSRPAPFGGDLYRVTGELRTFGVVTIWLLSTEPNTWRFVTLFPDDL